MKYHVQAKFTIDFDDYIDVPEKEIDNLILSGKLNDYLKKVFWDKVDHCIVPDFGVSMGDMSISDMQYEQVKER